MTVLSFTHDQLPGRIVFGAGRRNELPAELDGLGATSVLTIGGSHDKGAMDALTERLAIPTAAIIGVRPHVPAEAVQAALDIVDDARPNVVVTVGGGSATGLGKMIALQRDVILVAVPTTYAGSEMTPIWGTTDQGVKRTGRSLRVLPATVVYDPELTIGLPKAVTVNSAFNALAHCVEALWLPDTSPMAAESSILAIKTITTSVEDVAAQLDDVEARSRLLFGSHRAGAVLGMAGTGVLHKIAHVLGGMFDLDHGAMYAVLTPHVVEYQLSRNPGSRAALTDALGVNPQGTLVALAERLQAPRTLSELGFPADCTQSAAAAVAQHAGVDLDEIEPLLTAAVGAHLKLNRDDTKESS